MVYDAKGLKHFKGMLQFGFRRIQSHSVAVFSFAGFHLSPYHSGLEQDV